ALTRIREDGSIHGLCKQSRRYVKRCNQIVGRSLNTDTGAIAACALPWLTSLPLQHASFIMYKEASLIALSSLYQIITGAITHGTRGRGGRGKSIGHSSSNVSYAYAGQSSYSGGRGKSVRQSNYNVRKAYVTDEGLRRTIESYSDLRASVYVKRKGPLKAIVILETKWGD
nr:hypothetical protein [Tanacetum cinerariifolium]